MKEEIKKTYRGFVGWLRYVRDYKDNIDNDLVSEQRLIEANKRIKKETKKYDDLLVRYNAIEQLLEKNDFRIHELNEQYGELKKEIKVKDNMIVILNEQMDSLVDKFNEKEKQRRINATSIGHKQRKINQLQKELEKANLRINWLKNNQKAPTKEEIQAYDLQMKEVEKRIKDGRSNNNI